MSRASSFGHTWTRGGPCSEGGLACPHSVKSPIMAASMHSQKSCPEPGASSSALHRAPSLGVAMEGPGQVGGGLTLVRWRGRHSHGGRGCESPGKAGPAGVGTAGGQARRPLSQAKLRVQCPSRAQNWLALLGSHCSSRTMEGSLLAPLMNSSRDSLPSLLVSICLKILSVRFSGVDSSSGIFITDDTIL